MMVCAFYAMGVFAIFLEAGVAERGRMSFVQLSGLSLALAGFAVGAWVFHIKPAITANRLLRVGLPVWVTLEEFEVRSGRGIRRVFSCVFSDSNGTQHQFNYVDAWGGSGLFVSNPRELGLYDPHNPADAMLMHAMPARPDPSHLQVSSP